VPGARSRFDDFVATHINQTLAIHYTGNFLAWHRYYTWLYEEALRNECGYTGNQPVGLLPQPPLPPFPSFILFRSTSRLLCSADYGLTTNSTGTGLSRQ